MLVFSAGDPAKLWQVQSFLGQSQGSSEMAANVFLYTANRAELRHKDETYLVKIDANVKAEKSVRVTPLMYEGKDVLPDPEPGGWRRLPAISHNQYKVDLDVHAGHARPGQAVGRREDCSPDRHAKVRAVSQGGR